jgi:hypothetical protein
VKQILHLPNQSVKIGTPFFSKLNRPFISTLLAGTALATFFYPNSPPLALIRSLVSISEKHCFSTLNDLSVSLLSHSLPSSWQFLACLAVAFIAASLVALTRLPDRQRLLSILLGCVCLGLLLQHPASNTGWGWSLCGAWILSNLFLERICIYVNLAIFDLICWAILWQFAEPHRAGFQHSESLAMSLGLPWLGWPIGLSVALMIGSITAWGTRKGFGATDAALLHHRTYH